MLFGGLYDDLGTGVDVLAKLSVNLRGVIGVAVITDIGELIPLSRIVDIPAAFSDRGDIVQS